MNMKTFLTSEIASQRGASGKPYLEFLREKSLSVGLYEIPAGGVDHQTPHSEDEVYYIVRGRARFRGGETEIDVEPGKVIFVEAGVHHLFHTISEDLTILVFFAPPEGSNKSLSEP